MGRSSIILIALVFTLILNSCNSCRRNKYYEDLSERRNSENRMSYNDLDNVNESNESYQNERNIRGSTKVKMTNEDGVYYVPICVNGLQLRFIIDTGASTICISSAEALVMYKQGKITSEDIIGQSQFMDATGNISVGTIIRLHTVEIGGITLHNVEANVVDEISAPLLLGQTALSQFGKISIDYDKGYIEFN